MPEKLKKNKMKTRVKLEKSPEKLEKSQRINPDLISSFKVSLEKFLDDLPPRIECKNIK